MERLKRFEDYEYLKDDYNDMMLEEWKLPTYQDIIKRKLSFLKSKDLKELEPSAAHQTEIKELWRKIMKKMYSKDKAQQYITIVDNATVHDLENTLDVIKKIKESLIDKKDIGIIVYSDKNNKFYYDKPLSY